MHSLFGDRRKVLFVRNIRGTMSVVGKQLDVKTTTTKVTIRKGKETHTFKLDISRPSVRNKRNWIYFVDIVNGQIDFGETVSPVSSDAIDMFTFKPTIKQLVAGIEKPDFMNYIVYILLALGMGIPLGYIIGNLVPIG